MERQLETNPEDSKVTEYGRQKRKSDNACPPSIILLSLFPSHSLSFPVSPFLEQEPLPEVRTVLHYHLQLDEGMSQAHTPLAQTAVKHLDSFHLLEYIKALEHPWNGSCHNWDDTTMGYIHFKCRER